ncbi:hypothetical protein ACHAXS_008809 [Conticribra weissflogii]
MTASPFSSGRAQGVDGRSIDDQLLANFELYGFDDLECSAYKRRNFDDDAESEDSGKDSVPLQDRIKSRLFLVRETTSGDILWKCPIEQSDSIAEHLVESCNLKHRLNCHSFRYMLPSLEEGNRPPVRSPLWMKRCMKGILFSALKDYASDLSANASDLIRTHFPEHVYVWFDNDEDRWAFYYGLKKLSKCDSLAWIVYTLLDDKDGEEEPGEHFFAFLSDAMDEIRNRMGLLWSNYISPWYFQNIHEVRKEAEITSSKEEYGDCFDQAFWLPLEIAKDSTNKLFGSGWIRSPSFVESLVEKLHELALDTPKLNSEGDVSTRGIELFSFMQLILKYYLTYMKKRTILIRSMINASFTRELTDVYPSESTTEQTEEIFMEKPKASFPEFCTILKIVWPAVDLKEIAAMYRIACDVEYPRSQWNRAPPQGVSYCGFAVAAERRCFFTRLRRHDSK